MKNRRNELQKGVRLHAEHWKYEDYPKFKQGDIVYTYGNMTIAQVVIHQYGPTVMTKNGNYHMLDIKYFVLQPEPEVINLRKVDFQLLKIAINQLENGNLPNDPQRDNLALFFEMLGKSSSFAHLVHKQLKP